MTKDDGSELGRMLRGLAQGRAEERARVVAQAAEVWDNERRAGMTPEDLIADAVDYLAELAEDASSDYGPDQRLTNRTRDAYALHVPALLSMVKRLERENAQLREIVQKVVADHGPLVQDSEFLYWSCGLCDGDGYWIPETEDQGRSKFVHMPDCPVTKIRVLLGEVTAGSEGG